MRVLMWHGYLLTGSGSNVYTANVARALRAGGHDVLVLCQEHRVSQLDFVDAAGDLSPGNSRFDLESIGIAPAPGRVRLARPDIGRRLPLYVFDEYEGFEAKTFVDLDDDELQHYVAANVEALVTAIEEHRPEAIMTGHEVMGPYIAKLATERTGTRFVAYLHGSALEFAVKRQERYLHYATEGLNAADAIIGGSEYMVREASAVIPGWLGKAKVVNPGCDVDLFRPRKRSPEDDPVAGFVGKFIPHKGLHHMLPALGLTGTPGLRATIVGYGGSEARLRALWDALTARDTSTARDIAARGEDEPLGRLLDFLDSGEVDDAFFARLKDVELRFTGRLEHDALSGVLPTFDVLVVPSVGAEAFGMVAAEAAACGVLPIVPDHSGIAEAGRAVEEALGEPGLLTFDPDDPIRGIAEAIDAALARPFEERVSMAERAAGVARARWSWSTVAEALLGHATART